MVVQGMDPNLSTRKLVWSLLPKPGQHGDGVGVVWVELQGTLVVCDGIFGPAGEHAGLGEAVVGVEPIREGLDVELEDDDRLIDLVASHELVSERIELGFAESPVIGVIRREIVGICGNRRSLTTRFFPRLFDLAESW
jgi:hypothetical protein